MEPLKRDGVWYYCETTIETGAAYRVQAKDIRRERTGVHATLAIVQNGHPIAWTNFNIERDEDRVRIVNSAYGHVKELDGQLLTKQYLKSMVDAFCYALWPATVADAVGEITSGDPSIGPPLHLLAKYLVEGGGSIIFAPPGRGKSYIGLTMAVCMDAGHGALWPVEQRRVLYVNLERSRESMAYRLSRVGTALGIDREYSLPMLHKRGARLSDLEEAIRATVETFGCQVAIIDSLSRAGYGDLNENRPANEAMDVLNRLVPTWVLLAHTPRGDESHTFGSVMFDAAADVTVKLTTQLANDGDTLGVGLMVEKANDGPRGPKTLTLTAFDFGSEGLYDIRPAKESEFPDLLAGDPLEVIRAYLVRVESATVTQIHRSTGLERTKIGRLLKAAKGFSTTKIGKEVYFHVADTVHT